MTSQVSPALDEKARNLRKEKVELCGKNRGPHDYIPIESIEIDGPEKGTRRKKVTRLMCRVCFSHVEVGMLVNEYPQVKL